MSLLAQTALFEALFESPHVLVAVLDTELRFVRVNQTYAEASSSTPASFAGQRHFDLFPDAENEALFLGVLRSGRPLQVHAKPFTHPDQPTRPVTYWDWTLRAITDERADIVGLLLQLVDVTDRVVVEQVASERQLLLREIHHRVKNNIQMVSSFIREVSFEHPVARSTVDRAIGRVSAISRMHDALTRSPDLATVNLVTYAESILGELRTLYARSDVSLVVRGEASASIDVARMIGLIVQELTSNAFEHAFPERSKGTIEVVLETTGSDCHLEICDDGIGLPVQREASHGLDLVLGLCAQLGGSFEAHASTPRGTCCRVRVPLDRGRGG